jgi:hypothetical protein
MISTVVSGGNNAKMCEKAATSFVDSVPERPSEDMNEMLSG